MAKSGRLVFRPAAFSTWLVVLFVPVFCLLGTWQLWRGSEKEQMFERFEQLGRDAPIVIDEHTSASSAQDLRYRRLQATGYYLSSRQFMRDNRTHKGVAGYHVLTPLKFTGSDMAVLVNRGWVPTGERRENLPNVRIDESLRTVQGMAHLPDARTMVLGKEEPEGWPRVIQKVDFSAIEKALGFPVLPVIIRLDEEDDSGFIREWQPYYGIGPNKHRAYAIQWFSFGVLALGLYIGLNLKRVPVTD